MRSFILGILVLFAVQLDAQRTLHVPADYPTIQAGIDAAQPGDTVLVAPSIWLENLDFHGKAITVESAEGPALTILDGRRLAPTVSFISGETRSSVLTGFTIRNGAPAPAVPGQLAPHGAGALLTGSSPTLSANIFRENLCAALDATASAPLLQDNQFTRTEPDPTCLAQAIAPITLTGAFANPALLATLMHNTIEDNLLTGSEIQPNASAIALLGARAILQSNTIRNNSVSGDSPAIQILANPTATLTTPALVQQNLIYGNTSQCGAGLLISLLNDPTATSAHLELEVVGNTIADNTVSPACPAATAASEFTLAPGALPAQILVANNIFAGSSAYPALSCAAALPGDAFHHNLLHNTAGPTLSPLCPDSTVNLNDDPLFLDRAAHDYHLNLHSTAVDAGSNTVAPRPPHDLDNAARLQNATDRPTAIIDLGAFEYPAPKDAVAPSTTIVNINPFPAQAFQSTTLNAQVTSPAGTVPTGTVTFTASTRTLATVPLDIMGYAAFTTTSLSAAAWNVTATYSGSASLEPSTSAPLSETVTPAATQLAFAVTPSIAAVSQAIVFTASVTAPLSTHTPSGAVQFFDVPPTGTPIPLGSPALDATGHTTLTLSTLAEGVHHIMAAYPGAPNFAPVTLPSGDALTLTISARGYLQDLSVPTLTLVSSHHGPVTVTLTSLGTFADTLTLTCANLPPSASCSFATSPTTLTAGAKSTVILTIDTDAIPGFVAQTRPPSPTPRTGSTVAFAGLLSLGLLMLRRTSRPHRARLSLLSTLLVAVTLFGCGAGQYPAHTPPGTYQITIISNATKTGQTQTTPLTLIVTP